VAIAPAKLHVLLRKEFTWNRSLARGNPHPAAIGSDFGRLGIGIWTEVYALDSRNNRRRELLEELIEWRNAISHQDFDPLALSGAPVLHLPKVRAWRSALNALARNFDEAMYNYLPAFLGNPPWQP
jgi:hypothetical protein